MISYIFLTACEILSQSLEHNSYPIHGGPHKYVESCSMPNVNKSKAGQRSQKPRPSVVSRWNVYVPVNLDFFIRYIINLKKLPVEKFVKSWVKNSPHV